MDSLMFILKFLTIRCIQKIWYSDLINLFYIVFVHIISWRICPFIK